MGPLLEPTSWWWAAPPQGVPIRDLLKLVMEVRGKTTMTYTLSRVLLEEFNPGGELTDGAEETDYFKPSIVLAYAWFNFGIGTDKSL